MINITGVARPKEGSNQGKTPAISEYDVINCLPATAMPFIFAIMNSVATLIKDLEAIRRHIDEHDDEASNVATAYLLANREAITHYVSKLYADFSSRRREHLAAEFPTIDYSVVDPVFEKLAMQSIKLASQAAWLGVSQLEEDDVHMTIRALRAAEILVDEIPCVVFLSPVERLLNIDCPAG